MSAILVRIGIDHAYGGWNAPMSLRTADFVYVPIPENKRFTLRGGMNRTFDEVVRPLESFANRHRISYEKDLMFTQKDLLNQTMHLDPDFEFLTYGDNGTKRGSGIALLKQGDHLIFYSGLRPIEKHTDGLVYALVGFFVINDVVPANAVTRERYHENAHTRKTEISPKDIIVRGDPSQSGRLSQCVPIGEYRNKAYRVRRDLLTEWGGLSVNDGYIQRSAVPPHVLNPEKFISWFSKQRVALERRNF